jgi:hypothetical protein
MSEIHYIVMAEYGGTYDWIRMEEVDGGNSSQAFVCDWIFKHPISEGLHKSFISWLREFERAPVDDGCVADLDWPRFHDRGLALTRRVKAELGDAARIFYVKAYEDPNGYVNERVEILADGSIIAAEKPISLRERLHLPAWFPTMIVSGGQTGVDRAALDWACRHRIPHGGWCPMGRRAEDGPLPWKYQMRITESSDYRPRTEWNVRDSDGTLILNLGKLNGGTLATQSFAREMNKPCLLVPLDSGVSREAVASVHAWLREHRFNTLNVAGPRQSKRPGIYRLSLELLEAVHDAVLHPAL